MVFQTTTLFKGIPCPEGVRCSLTSCIFAHDVPQPATLFKVPDTREAKDAGPPQKKRRVIAENRDQPSEAKPMPVTLKREVSPPRTKSGPVKTATAKTVNQQRQISKPGKVETLNPRLVSNDPIGHSKRKVFLDRLYAAMVKLNAALLERQDTVQFKAALALSEQELITLALDEEEHIARTEGSVYRNVISQRILRYEKRMKSDDWIDFLKTTSLFKSKTEADTSNGGPPNGGLMEKKIDTGLTFEQEIEVATRFCVTKDQSVLAPFEYVPVPPTAQQAQEAANAVTEARNYEMCARCGSRFQVFPTREAETGRLTSNGPCRHHPRKKVFPQRTKADLGPREAFHPCCNEVVGSVGCVDAADHVFKTTSPARLAAVLPFVTTPDNVSPRRAPRSGRVVKAVCFDCEMGYTTLGLELIRLTAISWPDGEELIDVLVRPLGIIIDLNSQFSGVWPDDLTNGIPYREWTPPSLTDTRDSSAPTRRMPVVDSPAKARELLCSYLTPQTALIGHAIENDLNTTRLCHPTIIDTVLRFPHFRGLPLRYGLKMLSEKHLQRVIQHNDTGKGHDSLEDARATGDLVRVDVGQVWNRELKPAGWRFVDGKLVPPSGKTDAHLEKLRASKEAKALHGSRKRGRDSGADGVSVANWAKENLEVTVEGGGEVGDGGSETKGREHKLSREYLEDE
ncbi:rna exonuclease [Teratosphaeria destructans]|uniref:Rna exonuclease n=1 Tax=Teratosphaeria destructans TaxID=418781 RepID=A0A9W7SYQ1_9PEZI|nr:rna exonuclease [Teratosphaeria destructans]